MKKNLIIFTLIFSLLFIGIPSFGQSLPDKYLKYGSRGNGVAEVQKALNKIGYHLYADGIYGKSTKSAILDLQKKYKELKNDGIYGANTKRVIEKLIGEEVLQSKDKGKDKDEKKSGKIAYLTFDDGPSTTNTPDILDILNKYGINATFFILGSMAEKNPDLIKRINSEGNSIGNHSYSHKYKYLYKNMDNFLGEINKTDSILKIILGQDFKTHLLRFPGGDAESYKDKYKDAAKGLGYKIYNWNALNGDSESKQVSADKLFSRLKQTTKGQKELIILMHDNYGKETTVKALPSIIDYLISQGYTFGKLVQ